MKATCVCILAAIIAIKADQAEGNRESVFIHFERYAVNEGDPGAVARVRVDRVGLANRRTTVSYSLLEDTATAGDDFDGIPGTVTFEADERTQYIRIPIFDDSELESNEMFEVRLDHTDNGSLGETRQVAVYIMDDELKAYLQANQR
ncbi:adhesion G-protein coupled receptor V1-like [Haliotis rubra]|uniref:adhesion G-protein coupled receptor V1-like n=1 Tax=Haliotis rubra TaxID=36100 RepID=UPI001EE5C557|nr:adhesion G-protein coupled receptor V1-like [Haliotis rubra]